MKHRDLIKKLTESGCELLRHGAKHDIYHNPETGNPSPSHVTRKSTNYWPRKSFVI
jgi:hypothetical protein